MPPSNDFTRPLSHQAMAADAVDLNQLYAPPTERIQQAVLDHLVDFHQAYLAQARFFCLATGDANGLDASPRGGPAGFVHVLDAHTLAFADWPGNNRIASLRNLQNDAHLAMLFLFPGMETFLRINGRGRISCAQDLLEELREGEKCPKTAIVVQIDEVLFHCGRAIHRAQLWQEERQPDPALLPTIGQMMAGFAQMQGDPAFTPEQITQADARYQAAVKTALY